MREHVWTGVVLAVIAVIFYFPRVIMPLVVGKDNYRVFAFHGSSMTMEEIYAYIPEIRELIEGKRWISDTQLAEYKNRISPHIGETGLAYVMLILTLLSGSIERSFLVAGIIFPALTVGLIYWWLWKLTGQKILALTAGVTIVLFPEIVSLFPYFHKLWDLLFKLASTNDFLFFSRIYFPQLSFFFYMTGVVLLWKALANKGKLFVWAAGIMVGLQFYFYIFSWTSLSFGMVIMGLIFLAGGDRRAFHKLFKVGSIALLIASPYFVSSMIFKGTSLWQDFFYRSSTFAHNYWLLIIRYLVAIVLFAKYSRLKKLENKFIFSLWLAPIILPIIMQTVLGRDLEADHWISRLAIPWTVIGMSAMLGSWMVKSNYVRSKTINVFLVFVLIIELVAGFRIQLWQSRNKADRFIKNESLEEVFSWINGHTKVDDVIASLDWETIGSIPAFTGANNFAPIGIRSISPTKELEERYLWLFGLYDANPEYVRLMFTSPSMADAGELVPRIFYFTYSNSNYLFDIPRVVTEKIVDNYLLTRNKIADGAELPYRLDYILVSPTEKKIVGENSVIRKLEKVLENEKYALYKYN